MKKLLLLSTLLFIALTLQAQKTPNEISVYKITGQVTEAVTDKAIPYATISAQSDSLKNVIKLCSDVNGKFDVRVNRKGKYVFTFSGVGLKEEVRTIEIGDTAVVEMGKVKMGEGVNLKQVDVVAQKPLIKVDVDKITYSIEADPESQTSNALEMLRKVPLLDVDGEDNVTLNGQSNFKVLVNGKSSSMMSKNFKELIKSLPANSIKDIEVITNPSSKYEAEGIGGIINIITIKKTLNGYNGSVNAGFDTFGAMNGGVYFSTKINKFGFSGRYSIYQNKQPEGTNSSIRENYLPAMENQYYMNTNGINNYSGSFQNFNGEASYDIDSLNLISMSFWGYSGNYNNNGKSVTEIQNSQRVRTSYFEMSRNGRNSFGNLAGNIDYQKTFKKPDKSFTISYKLENEPSTSDNTTETDNEFNYEASKQHLISDDFTREQTLQVDYYDPLTKKHQIECGIKGIYRQNESNSDVHKLNPLTEQIEYDAQRSNELVYDQTIVGLYGGYVYSPGKFSLKSGLRAELTWNDAISKSVRDTSFSSTLKNVVPYLTLTYKLKPTQTLKLSYTQRLQRPGIWYLNPYRNDLNRLYVYYGNPDLKSEVAHSFEAGYNNFTPKFNIGLTATASFANNSIEQITFLDSKNVQNITFANIGKNRRAGLSTYLSYRPNAKLNVGFNGGITYAQMEATSMGRVQNNDGFYYRISINGRITLWKDGAVNVNGGYNSPSIRLQGKFSGYNYSNIGLSQYFLKRKLMLSLSFNNPFTKELKFRNESSTPDFKYFSENINISRSLRLNLSYNFGKMGENVRKAKRSIQNDDLKSGEGAAN